MRYPLGTILIAALSTGCLVSKSKYTELQAKYDELESRHSTLVSTADGMRLEIDDLEEYVDLLKQSNEHLGSFYTELITDFRPQLESDEVELIVYPDRMSLALSQDVNFNSGSARMSQVGDDTMDTLAGLVERHPDRRFVVEGHTDDRPLKKGTSRYRNNWELGAARAVAVVEALVEQGVPADRLAVVSYGDTEPLAPNDSAATQKINRRVEISFQPTLEELPGHRALVDAAEQVTVAHGASADIIPELSPEVAQTPATVKAASDGAVPVPVPAE